MGNWGRRGGLIGVKRGKKRRSNWGGEIDWGGEGRLIGGGRGD